MSNFPVVFPVSETLFSSENSQVYIKYDSDHNQCYFELNVSSEEPVTKYYINFTEDVAENTCVLDYFNTYEIFINIKSPFVISHVLPTIYTLHSKYLRSTSPLSVPPPSLNYKPISFAVSVVSPTNPNSYAWSFPLSTFFSTFEDSNHEYYKNVSSKNNPPICSYYSVINDSLDITSSSFNFANKIPNYHFCSHMSMSSDNKVATCTFALLNLSQTTCVIYSPRKDLIFTNKISLENTSEYFTISLYHSLSLDGSHIFFIVNDRTSENISVLEYPKDTQATYDILLQEVTNIYNSYISCYNDSQILSIDNLLQKSEIQKRSFIQSLIEV